MSKIVIAGSINMDVVAQTKQHPKPGETVFGHDLHFIPGGKGSNQAVAAARLTDDVYLVGKLGNDRFGKALQDFLNRENLNLEHVAVSDSAPSGTALIVVDEQSENTIVMIPGANYEVQAADVERIHLNENDIVLSPFEIPQEAILAFFKRAKQMGAKTVLNPAPAAPFIAGLQAQIDYLIVNETELAFFLGHDGHDDGTDEMDALRAQAEALRHHAQQNIIITLGRRGVLCLAGDDWMQIEGRSVEAVDTTGAGDCFTGAFAVALSEGHDLPTALHFANVAAALSVQQLGASASMPTREAVERALQSR